ncbi:hypothetical protein LQG66_06260 [Bradyrhizobium ontarionense]|uniref:Uncharacterized protein n=1 Tax=Bradyrhizobium ontarionense TaxID=2898149 RepID=A0ABY3RF17_9BRAD|nr:hypothetical protein [Bradyrhizobium sp. A19]UFZ05908.1 hypothetical protein LQG66_06260 [Bradyrhizobium sp. A19]
MALHRDIFWIGRQWAVTGHGLQAVDQRLKGAFDIDRSRVWDDGLLDPLRKQAWFNEVDFEKALGTARARFPAAEQPGQAQPPAAPDQPVSALRLCTRGRLARFLPQWRIRY